MIRWVIIFINGMQLGWLEERLVKDSSTLILNGCVLFGICSALVCRQMGMT